ncbi:flavodoxin [uncultured Fretibacterium sp.]|uniref:flavodoxin n=1 Tax=uncultured Fretibacterium sp. TaxID=1678694 RepID=UPI0026024B4B|nr:flavodoxin [uncultured Fretibacterium sp.]
MVKFLGLLAFAAAFLPCAALAAENDMVLVKGGSFTMGSPNDEPWRSGDETAHPVELSDFYIAAREVTQAEWEAVTWNRASDGWRLPTEAEWEYACRAGSAEPFSGRASIGPDEANFYGHYPYNIEQNYFTQEKLEVKPGQYRQRTTPAGSFAPNALGLYDMHGNVGEWCWDTYGEYGSGGTKDPAGPEESSSRMRKVNRGGGWNDFAKHLRCAYRASLPPARSSASVGMRLARNAVPMAGLLTSKVEVSEPGKGEKKEPKVLVAFFSWGGTTRGIAGEVRKQSGGDLFEIEPVREYSSDYNTVLNEAQRDQRENARPKLKGRVENFGQYDVILLGYPNWWASVPAPVASFLESYDFSGRTIIPFCSHGGGRLGQSVTAIGKLAPNAVIGTPLSVHYGGGSSMPADVAAWLAKNELNEEDGGKKR